MPYDPKALQVLSKGELIALLCQQPRRFSATDLHFLYARTYDKLRLLDCRAREGKDLMEAADFARWVAYSGLLNLFRLYPADGPREVSAAKLEALVKDTLYDCELAWKKDSRGPWVERSELESINHKLDILAAHIARLSPPVTAETASTGKGSEPVLQVIEGGA